MSLFFGMGDAAVPSGDCANHPLLAILLTALPAGARRRQAARFRRQHADFEFGTWVPRDEMEAVVEQALECGFWVWASVDAGSVFLYGAKLVGADAPAAIAWLRGITAAGQEGRALWRRPGRAAQLIRFDSARTRSTFEPSRDIS